MGIPDRFRMPITDALPFVTAASLEQLAKSLPRQGMPPATLDEIVDLLAEVNEAVMRAPDPKLAYNQALGELLNWSV